MRVPVLLSLQISLALGHGEVSEQIEAITARIEASPNQAQLWITRADLHQSHRDPAAALADLRQATRLTPPHPPAFLKLAGLQRKNDDRPAAKRTLEAYFHHLADSPPAPDSFREKALLSSPGQALEPWRLYFQQKAEPVMHDYVLAARTALEARQPKSTREFILAGLNRHPKSIELHQLHARLALASADFKSAESSFKILKLLYPNLLVKLYYEESLIWSRHHHHARVESARRSALRAYQQLPSRLQECPDLQKLVVEIESALLK